MSSPSEDRARLHGGGSESCAVTGVAPAVAMPVSKSTAELETKLTALTVMDGDGHPTSPGRSSMAASRRSSMPTS